MKNIIILLSIFSLILIGIGGCRESLEDTFSDYNGDGPVRYVGGCTDVNVEAGWNRLTVKWTNSNDPNVVENKITCKAEGYSFDTIVPAKATECIIYNLQDYSYEISVVALDKEGNASLIRETSSVYSRPYTYNHEEVKGFTRGITKHYFVKNNLVLFYGQWETNIDRFWLEYTGTDGSDKTLELTQEEFNKQYVLVKDVDATQPVTLKRKGRLANCPDIIEFEDYMLTNEPVLLSDFKLALRERYGETGFKADFLNRIETLELDYDLVSMEDILAFPNLKKVELGKNRYFTTNTTTNLSTLTNVERSLFCIHVAKEILGAEINRYATNYFPLGTPDINDMGVPALLDVAWLNTTDWKVSCSPVVTDFDERYLLDDDINTLWKPLAHSGSIRNFELIIDMQAAQNIDGIKVVQANVNGAELNFLPISIEVSVSTNKEIWENATYVQDNTLGDTPGEATMLRFCQTWNARYIKVKISDRRYNGSLNTLLADIIPFTNK